MHLNKYKLVSHTNHTNKMGKSCLTIRMRAEVRDEKERYEISWLHVHAPTFADKLLKLKENYEVLAAS